MRYDGPYFIDKLKGPAYQVKTMDGKNRMVAVSRGFQINRKVKHTKMMIKMFSLCVNSLLHGTGIVLQHLLGGYKSANNFHCMPTLYSNSERLKKGAPLKVDVK